MLSLRIGIVRNTRRATARRVSAQWKRIRNFTSLQLPPDFLKTWKGIFFIRINILWFRKSGLFKKIEMRILKFLNRKIVLIETFKKTKAKVWNWHAQGFLLLRQKNTALHFARIPPSPSDDFPNSDCKSSLLPTFHRNYVKTVFLTVSGSTVNKFQHILKTRFSTYLQ